MQLSVTVLGSNGALSPQEVGKKVASYLERGRVQNVVVSGSSNGQVSSAAMYYADSAGLRPGHWLLGRTGEVDPSVLASLLSGVEPETGAPLISAAGSAGRSTLRTSAGEGANSKATLSQGDFDRDWYTVKEAAELLGVSSAYVYKYLKEKQITDGLEEVIARDTRGRRVLERELVCTIAQNRRPARVVAGYDLTFSPVKSISVLWAIGDEVTRTAILDAIDSSVRAGVSYLERNAFSIRTKGERESAGKIIAADYLHTTSRALEPQLHHHVIVANVGVGRDGVPRALDSTMLFRHAKTAAFLAAAELRHELSLRLGVTWTKSVRGISEIEGIPEEAIREMSSRKRQIDAAVSSLGLSSTKARQIASWNTRAAKVHGVDQEELFSSWEERLRAAGFGDEQRDGVLCRVDGPTELLEEEKAQLFEELLLVDAMTKNTAIFDRRETIQRLAERLGDQMAALDIEELADEFLSLPDVVALGVAPRRNPPEKMRNSSEHTGEITQRNLPGPSFFEEQRYSTTKMLALEQRALDAYERGRDANIGAVRSEQIETVLLREEFFRLSKEQREFVSALTGSSQQIQLGVGAAGSGKTTALRAAVAIWQEAGLNVLGAAVGGTQAVKLSEETGIEARTVSSLLARYSDSRYFDYGDRSLVDGRTVVLVDEASLVSTKDFAALAQMTAEHHATLCLTGDPAQHSSVEAGGIFRYLVEQHPGETPELKENLRQRGKQMEQVRIANAEFREGKVRDALERLARDERITEASSADEAYDLLVRTWYAERQQREKDPTRHKSAMTAEHHVERKELNKRARDLLQRDGTLTGPELKAGELSFQRGDEVVARVPDRSLRALGADRDSYLRNGSWGRVLEVKENSLLVDFERWGEVLVPRSYLEQKLSSGLVGALQHAYALTTYAAQGETFAAASPLLTDASSPEGLYVGLTRGQFDLHAVAIRHDELVSKTPDDLLPVLENETEALRSTADQLERKGHEELASEWLND